jgi:hypothetical protein
MNRAQKHREKEIVRLLKESGAKDALDKLCNAGCDRDSLVGWLLALSTVIAFDRIGPATSRYAFPCGKEITKLSADIEDLATRLERANADPIVSPVVVFDALTKPRGPETDTAYKRQTLAYHALPEMLRNYAGDVRKSHEFVLRRIGPKRFSLERYLVQKLFEYVVDQTGQPHYEPVHWLLVSAFRITSGEATPIPKLLESPDALKQLWARSLKYGFRQNKKPDTSHPILKLKLWGPWARNTCTS